jgi:hypothetical protein
MRQIYWHSCCTLNEVTKLKISANQSNYKISRRDTIYKEKMKNRLPRWIELIHENFIRCARNV